MYTCMSPHEMTWWSDKCSDCGHMLAMHRDVSLEAAVPEGWVEGDPVDPPTNHPFGECSLCKMERELTENMTAQNTALREFATGLKGEAQEYASGLRDQTKQYIDSENAKFAEVAKNYVDEHQTTAKTYVDQEISKVRTDVPTWTNNRLVAVIKTEAFKADPRTLPN